MTWKSNPDRIFFVASRAYPLALAQLAYPSGSHASPLSSWPTAHLENPLAGRELHRPAPSIPNQGYHPNHGKLPSPLVWDLLSSLQPALCVSTGDFLHACSLISKRERFKRSRYRTPYFSFRLCCHAARPSIFCSRSILPTKDIIRI